MMVGITSPKHHIKIWLLDLACEGHLRFHFPGGIPIDADIGWSKVEGERDLFERRSPSAHRRHGSTHPAHRGRA